MTANASAAETINAYYAALRGGDPLEPFFLPDEATTKFGVSDSLSGYDEVAAALREQTESTAEWTVRSHDLAVDERGECAIFADEVTLAWTDRTTGERWRFETRWSGTLVRVEGDESETGPNDTGGDEIGTDENSDASGGLGPWRFHTMHVSAPREL